MSQARNEISGYQPTIQASSCNLLYVKYWPEDDLNVCRSKLSFTLKDPVVILINSCVDGGYIIISDDYTALPLLCQFQPQLKHLSYSGTNFCIQVCFLCYQSPYQSYCLEICDRVDFATELRIDNI
jgi:hypothetical protein